LAAWAYAQTDKNKKVRNPEIGKSRNQEMKNPENWLPKASEKKRAASRLGKIKLHL
jgi:hypothetical protein